MTNLAKECLCNGSDVAEYAESRLRRARERVFSVESENILYCLSKGDDGRFIMFPTP